jgi:hypothetical protein
MIIWKSNCILVLSNNLIVFWFYLTLLSLILIKLELYLFLIKIIKIIR